MGAHHQGGAVLAVQNLTQPGDIRLQRRYGEPGSGDVAASGVQPANVTSGHAMRAPLEDILTS